MRRKRVRRHHREGEEPFLPLLSEYNDILLILDAILAPSETFKDHRMKKKIKKLKKIKDHGMTKHRVKVYPMLLAPRRDNC